MLMLNVQGWELETKENKNLIYVISNSCLFLLNFYATALWMYNLLFPAVLLCRFCGSAVKYWT